jgi:hypothetical protein
MRPDASRLSQFREHVRTVGDLWLAGRIFAWACCLPVLKRVVPLPALVRLIRRPGGVGARVAALDQRIVTFARWSCRMTGWPGRGNCLERGLLMYRFLGLVNARPSLVVGFGRGDEGAMRGHAWVLVDGQPVGEADASLSSFETAFIFDPDGRLCPVAQ